MKKTFLIIGVIFILFLFTSNVLCEFKFQDNKGKYLDILYKGKIVSRYMYAHDNSSKDTLRIPNI